MKKLMIVMVLAVAFISQSCSEGEKAPEAVALAFSQKFPDAQKVKWEMENDTEWEAEFKLNGKEYSANFSTNGEWQETEYRIKEAELPAEILAILNQNLTEYEIDRIEVAETSEGKAYEFEIEAGGDELEVIIDAQGRFTKNVEGEENDDND